MIAPMQVSVGKPVTFSGYAEDYGKQIVSVQFSLDNGANWTTYDVSDSTDDLWVHWTFSYTPERPGFYRLLVRSVNDAGAASPLADVAEFTAAYGGGGAGCRAPRLLLSAVPSDTRGEWRCSAV